MIVVPDTTPLNYLVLIGEIEVLPRLFTRVFVPEIVITELQHPRAPDAVRNWATNPSPDWLEIRNPSALEAALEFLGAGERAVIELAQEAGADAVLIDERAGRREAARRRLRVLGTLAVLDEAARLGLLDFAAALARLRQTNFRVSRALLSLANRERG